MLKPVMNFEIIFKELVCKIMAFHTDCGGMEEDNTECSKCSYKLENKTFTYTYIYLQKVLILMRSDLQELLSTFSFTAKDPSNFML
jgi:hypothetical protein